MHAVITGAANGIGASLARALLREGYHVLGIDQNEERLNQLEEHEANFESAPCDLLDRVALESLKAKLRSGPPIDCMIHCAGISYVGAFADSPLAAQDNVLNLNFRLPMQLTADLLHHERLSAQSHLVFIASLSVYVGYPGAAVYSASKAGLASYARSLSVGLAPRGIHVLTVFPGPTRTEHARRYSPDNRRESSRMDPDDLAQRILHAMRGGKTVLIPGWGNQLFALAGVIAPSVTERLMKRVIFDRVRK